MTFLKTILTAAALGLPVPVTAGQPGDAVFAERGPWSLEGETITWAMNIEGAPAEGFRPIKDGTIAMAEVTDPSDGQPVLELTQKTEAFERKIGPFPISSGDPVLTFFLEQTARDMSKLSGGSPFYIRNRMKEALFNGGTLTTEGDKTVATFEPFINETAPQRMAGFETLVLTFTMSDPAQPIMELSADTTPKGDFPPYHNHMVMQ